MIVVLHGMPGREGERMMYDTGKSFFQDKLDVPAVFMPPMSFADKYEHDAPVLKPVTLVFEHTGFDGTYENYVLTGQQ